MADQARGGRSGRDNSGRDNNRGGRDGAPSRGRSGDAPRGGGRTGGKPGERSGKPAGERSAKPYSRDGKPGERSGKPGERSSKPYSRDGKPGERSGKPGERSSKPYSRDGKPGDRSGKPAFERRPRRDDFTEERTADQRAYDGPDLPDDISGEELDRAISAQLKGLPEKLASRVARHLVAAGTFIDDDPELAYQHAKAAKSRAQRLAVVREAMGEAAYAAGHYAEALAELRAAKRMNGATAYLPIMADCHRALGQPEQAIKLAQSPSVRNFVPEAKAEMTIVEAGARRDLKQLDAALRTLELAPLMSKSRASWVVRLRYAYADTLVAAGRETEALTWFHRTFAIDADQITDAEERAAELEKKLEGQR